MTDTRLHILMSELTAALEADGYDMGTGKHLQVQELLRRLPADIAPERLSALLCPLFARNRQEQEDFYRLFEQVWQRVVLLSEASAERSDSARERQLARVWRNLLLLMTAGFSFLGGFLLDVEVFSSWRNPTIPIVVLSLLAAGYFVRRTVASPRKRKWWLLAQILAIVAGVAVKQQVGPKPPPPLLPQYVERVLRPGDTLTERISIPQGDSLLMALLGNGASSGSDSVFGAYQVSPQGLFTYIVRDTYDFFRDTILVEAWLASARRDTTFFVISLQLGIADLDLVKPDTSLALPSTKNVPFPRDMRELLPDPGREYAIHLYTQYAWVVKSALTVLSALGLLALLQWRERRRRFLTAVTQQKGRSGPPYHFRFRIEQPGAIVPGDSAAQLLFLLRRRIRGDAMQLDIPASIRATINRLGMADFRYKRLTNPPDYLLLIDRQSPNDHRSALYDWVCRYFQTQEAPLARYFFEGDIRLCFDEKNPEGIPLRELQHRYGNARLIVIGHGHQLLSPLTGRLERWVSMLTDWRRRAMLSPIPVSVWGRREQRIEEVFYLLPMSLQGWSAAVEQLDATEPIHTSEWLARLEDIQREPIVLEGDLMTSLRKHFSEPMIEWIAACAVYPLLQWELTLALGRQLSPPGATLLHFDQLRQLTRLPWFVAGVIPEAARTELVEYLASKSMEERVRGIIHNLLQQSTPPDVASAAYEEYRFNAALNALAITSNSKEKNLLKAELQGLHTAGHPVDEVAFKYVEEPPSRTAFTIPPWLRKLAEPAADRLRPAAFDLLWAIPLWAFFTAFAWWYNPPFDVCADGESVVYQNRALCIHNPTDQLYYNEMLVGDLIQQKNMAATDSLIEASRALFPACISADTIAFLKNVAVYLYNEGVQEFSRLQIDAGYQPVAGDPWPESACFWFAKAYESEIAARGMLDTDILSAAVRCKKQDEPATALPDPDGELKPIVVRGIVQAAATKRPLAKVKVSAGSFTDYSDKTGAYTLSFPAATEGSLVTLQFTRQGYAPAQLTVKLQPGATPPRVEMTQEAPVKDERLRTFRKGELVGLQDAKGNVLAPAEYYSIDYDAAGNWYKVEQRLRGSSIFGYLNSAGSVAIPIRYRNIGPLREGLIRAEMESGWGYINMAGQTVIPFQYLRAGDFSGGRAEVSLNSKGETSTFVIDKSNKCVANCPQGNQTPVPNTPTVLNYTLPMSLYFDENIPEKTATSYEDLLKAYLARRDELRRNFSNVVQQNNVSATDDIAGFFNQASNAFETLTQATAEIDSKLKTGLAPGESIVVRISGFAGDQERDASQLAARRAESVYIWMSNYGRGALQSYLKSGQLRIIRDGAQDGGIRGKEAADWLRDARRRYAQVTISVQNEKSEQNLRAPAKKG